jgi:hypothetical protein
MARTDPVDGKSLPLVPDALLLISDNRIDRETTIFLETDNHTEPRRRTTAELIFSEVRRLLAILGG